MLTRLRDGTRAIHARLEALPPLERIFAADYTLAEYARLLVSLAAVVRPLEARLQASPWHTASRLGYAARYPALAADLRCLGVDSVADIDPPGCLTESRPAEAGCLYVLAGSRLGGRVIARRLHGQLDLSVDRGLRFFGGAAGDPDGDWPRFCRELDALCRTRQATSTAVTAAVITFGLFHQCLVHE